METELALPAFQMDCRNWIVITPEESGLPDEIAGTPLLVVLSSAVIGVDEFRSVSAVLTLGLLDEDHHASPRPRHGLATGIATELEELDDDEGDGTVRYLLPAPGGRLALLAEFTASGGVDAEVQRRISELMTSFQWAA